MTVRAADLRKAAEGIRGDLIDFCQRLIRVPSETGNEGAVAEVGRVVVDLLVEHPHGEVGHPDLIRVGEAQRERRRRLAPGFAPSVQLAADVLRGLGDAVEEGCDVDGGVHRVMLRGCRHLVRHLSMHTPCSTPKRAARTPHRAARKEFTPCPISCCVPPR